MRFSVSNPFLLLLHTFFYYLPFHIFSISNILFFYSPLLYDISPPPHKNRIHIVLLSFLCHIKNIKHKHTLSSVLPTHIFLSIYIPPLSIFLPISSSSCPPHLCGLRGVGRNKEGREWYRRTGGENYTEKPLWGQIWGGVVVVDCRNLLSFVVICC